jgi:Fe-S-cluster containining protein
MRIKKISLSAVYTTILFGIFSFPKSKMKLLDYQRFLTQSDNHFSQIRQSHNQSFQCKMGCTGCCEPDLTVRTIEATNIVHHLLSNPQQVASLRLLEEDDPHKGSRCSFLTKKGACGIYSVRPFVCRSHGAPIAIAREEYHQIDVCPLNFTENPIEELDSKDFFILDDWNEQLISFSDVEKRIPLRLSRLLSGS